MLAVTDAKRMPIFASSMYICSLKERLLTKSDMVKPIAATNPAPSIKVLLISLGHSIIFSFRNTYMVPNTPITFPMVKPKNVPKKTELEIS